MCTYVCVCFFFSASRDIIVPSAWKLPFNLLCLLHFGLSGQKKRNACLDDQRPSTYSTYTWSSALLLLPPLKYLASSSHLPIHTAIKRGEEEIFLHCVLYWHQFQRRRRRRRKISFLRSLSLPPLYLRSVGSCSIEQGETVPPRW